MKKPWTNAVLISIAHTIGSANAQEALPLADVSRTEAMIRIVIDECFNDNTAKRSLLRSLSDQHVQALSASGNVPLQTLVSAIEQAREKITFERNSVLAECVTVEPELETELRERINRDVRAMSGED